MDKEPINMHDPAYMKTLFSRFITGECTPEEVEILIAYLENADDETALPSVEDFQAAFPLHPELSQEASDRMYERLTQAMKGSGLTAEKSSAEPQGAAEFARDKKNRTGEVSGAARRTARPYALRYLLPGSGLWKTAAAIALLMAFSLGGYMVYKWLSPDRYQTGYGEITTWMLEDGTRVTLNANSKLKASLSGDKLREVWLEGEAFFDVAHDNGRKFIVHTSQNLDVEVLGTEFNVKERQGAAEVVLNKGSVRIHLLEKDKAIMMRPGEMTEYRSSTQRLNKVQVDTVLYTSWKQNLLLFNETPLHQMAHTISSHFGYKVEFATDSLSRLHFTGSNPADNLDLLLKTLERSFGLKAEKRDDRIFIREKIKNK